MVGENEPWDRDGWAMDCRTCGVCHTCLPALRERPAPDALIELLPALGEN